MLQNNIEMNLKMRLIESGQTQKEIAEKLGVTLRCNSFLCESHH